MKSISRLVLGDLQIGEKHPCLVIPEGCDNHMGSVERAKEMAAAAKEAGARIIKWQLHLPDEEMVRDDAIRASKRSLKKWGSIWHFVKRFSLSVEDHYELKRYCDKIGIQYFCTPFSLRAAEILRDMGVSGFKVGSGENDDLPMIEGVAAMRKPMIISTGMTTLPLIDSTVAAVKAAKTPLALAHCMSLYAGQRSDQLNFGMLRLLRERYDVPVGLSDHTPSDSILSRDGREVSHEARMWAAVHGGAFFIEKHFTLDRTQKDADSCFSLDPKALRELISTVRAAEEALGDSRIIFPEEADVAEWAKRSLVSVRDIQKGEKITRAMLTSKRPGTGIRSHEYRQVIGMKVLRDVKKNSIIQWKDLNKAKKASK